MSVIGRGIRNAFRNWIRSVAIIIILGISIGLVLAMLMARQAVTEKINSVKSSIGNIITVTPAGTRDFEGGGEPLTTDQINKIKTLPHVITVNESLDDRLSSTDTNLQSAIDAGTLGNRQAQFLGRRGGSFTPPIITLALTSLDSFQSFGGGTISVSSGTKFDPAVDSPVALIGQGLATKNNLAVGSSFQAYGTTITVKGVFESGNRFSDNLVVMPLPTLQRLSGQTGNISSATVQVDSINNLDTSVLAIKNTLGSAADVVSQQDTSAQALAPLSNIQTVSLYSLIGAIIAGAAIILLTMVMIVRERRREIGVLKAIGATNVRVTTQFVVEALTLTISGLVVGIMIGTLAGNPITKLLVQNSSASATATPGARFGGRAVGQAANFFIRGGNNLQNIQVSLGYHTILYGIGAALLIALIGSALPVILVSRVKPAEVMRSE